MTTTVATTTVAPLTKAEVHAALRAAMAAPFTPARSCGCGRAYVCITGGREMVNAVAAAARKQGFLFVRKNHGAGGNAIYCGYDNADGRALGKAEAVAASLKAAGVPCYTDAASD